MIPVPKLPRPPFDPAVHDAGRASILACVCGIALLALLVAPHRAAAQFTELTPGLAAPPFPCVTWADYDGDGDLDLLIAGLGKRDIAFATLYRNDGGGTFIDSGIALLGLSRATAAWGDFDGDGDLDLAMTGLTTAGLPTTHVYRNTGGTFTAVAGNFLGVLAGNLAWADYDGDGDLDLLVTGVTSTVAGVGVASTRLYRNDGGTFTPITTPFPNCYLGGLAWADFDRDGLPDVVIAGTSENGPLFASIFHNDGGGAFHDIGANLPGDDLGPLAWGDYDHDGDLDLLFGGNSNDGFITRVYRNDAGAFGDIGAGFLPVLWAAGAWGDADDDGVLDLMVAGYDAGAQVPRSILYHNDSGTFANTGLPFHDLYLGTLSWADLDNDGDVDLLLAGNSAGQDLVLLYRNDATTPNVPPSAPTALTTTPTGNGALLSWGAASDDHTPVAGLSYNLRVGTTPGGSQVMSAQAIANGARLLPGLGNAWSNRFARVSGLVAGTTYYWSVQAIDASFKGSPFATEQSFTFTTAAVGDRPSADLASRASPNPFRNATFVRLVSRTSGHARMFVYDASGRLVAHAWEGEVTSGPTTVPWNGRDDAGRAVPAGIYLYRLEGRAEDATGRIVKLD